MIRRQINVLVVEVIGLNRYAVDIGSQENEEKEEEDT